MNLIPSADYSMADTGIISLILMILFQFHSDVKLE